MPNPRQLLSLRVPMRDGVELAARVFFPPGGRDGGPYPVLMERSCYSSQLYEPDHVRFREHGYAVLLQEVRGRGESGGVFAPIHQEKQDGTDTLAWLAEQEWCDGNVGTIGGSYAGWTQWALLADPAAVLRAAWVNVPAGPLMEQEPYDHGCLMLPVLQWLYFTSGRCLQSGRHVDWHEVMEHLPLVTMDEQLGVSLPVWREWLAHSAYDDYWREPRIDAFPGRTVPTVVSTGWFDSNLRGGTHLHRHLVDAGHDHQHLLIGPWDHASVGQMTSWRGWDFGPHAAIDLHADKVAWFDRWLKGVEAPAGAVARVFVTGANSWRSDPTWPPPYSPYVLFLDEGAALVTRPGAPGSTSYRYDPLDPGAVLGGSWELYPYTIRTGLVPGSDEETSDATSSPAGVVYDSVPLGDPLEAVGEGAVILHASSDRVDTDWFVDVEDVDPDGRVFPVTWGMLRSRFRETLEQELMLIPGETAEHRIRLRPMGHRFGAGHRVRLRVTSSRFPMYARNLNTGQAMDSSDPTALVATNTVHHGDAHPSRLELPLVLPVSDPGRSPSPGTTAIRP